MKLIILMSLVVGLFSCHQQKTEIYQWRGENRSGVFQENNLLANWPENGPEKIWQTEDIGNGYGSPAITENQVFVTGEIDSMSVLFCLGTSGEITWKTILGPEWTSFYPGSRSAPTVIGNYIYVGTGLGNLYCVNRENGEIIWQKNGNQDFNEQLPRFGHSEACVVDGDRIFWTAGGKEQNTVALNRFSGELLWACEAMGERSGYNPGNLIVLPERKIFVTFSAYHLLGIDCETGKLLWSHAQENTPVEKREPGIGDTHSNNIIFENGFIYYAAGDGNGGVKLQLSKDGTSIKEIWRNPDFDGYMGGIVKMDNHIYGCGSAKPSLKSIDVVSGELTDSLKIGSGAIISADGLLYYYSYKGEINMVGISEGKMEQRSVLKITSGTKEHFSHPVIKNGILYQRRGNALMAFDIRGKNYNSKTGILSFLKP